MRFASASIGLFAIILLSISSTYAAPTNDSIDPAFSLHCPGPDGPCTPQEFPQLRVRAAAREPSGSILLGLGANGGSLEGKLIRVDATTGAQLAHRDGDVNAIVVTDNGQIVIGGFSNSGGAGFVLLFARDSDFSSPLAQLTVDGPVNCLALDGSGHIIVGGNFTALGEGEVFTGSLGRLSASSLQPDPSFTVTVRNNDGQSQVDAVLVAGGDIIAGGVFDSVNGHDRSSLTRFVGGNASNLDTGFAQMSASADVMALAVDGSGRILVGGDFGVRRISGTAFDGFNPPLQSLEVELIDHNTVKTPFGVRSIAVQSDSKVLVGGIFDTVSGQNLSRNNIARFDSDGNVDTSFTIQAGGVWRDAEQNQTINFGTEVNVLTVEPSGNVLVGGILTGDFGSGMRTFVGRLLVTGGTTVTPTQTPTSTPGTPAIGSVDPGFVLNCPGPDPGPCTPQEFPGLTVRAAAREPSGSLLFGLGNKGGTTEGVLVRVNATTGTEIVSFDVEVNAIVITGSGQIIIGGFFFSGSQGVGYVSLFARDSDFTSALAEVMVDGPVNSLALDASGNIIVGGNFTTLEQGGTTVSTQSLGRLLASSLQPDSSFSVTIQNNDGRGFVDAVVVHAGDIIAGGGFDFVNGQDRSGLARFIGGSASALDTGFAQTTGSGDVLALAVDGSGRILVGGDFGVRRISGTAFDGFNPDLNSLETEPIDLNTVKTPFGVRSIAVQSNGQVLVGGIFDTVSGQNLSRNNIARFNSDGGVDSSFTIQAGGLWLDAGQNQTINSGTEVNVLTVEPSGNVLVGGILTGDFGSGMRTFVGRLILAPPTSSCTGDCGADDEVTVNELITMVNIALGTNDVAACGAGDANNDGLITINEIIAAVNNTLNGCPS